MSDTIYKSAAEHIADATVSAGDAAWYAEQGMVDDAAYSIVECRKRVERAKRAGASEEEKAQGAAIVASLPTGEAIDAAVETRCGRVYGREA